MHAKTGAKKLVAHLSGEMKLGELHELQRMNETVKTIWAQKI